MSNRIHNLVDEFLRVRRNSDGGWAQVTSTDLLFLNGIITQLLVEKFQEDSDGDLPVEFNIINRNTHQKVHYLPVPYTHPATVKEMMRRLSITQTNIQIAVNDLRASVQALEADSHE